MPSIHLRGLSYSHTVAVPVLTDASLELASASGGSWVGVVGANGVGKTTLLRLLAGELRPDAGDLDIESELPPLLVHQDVDRLTARVQDFGTAWDGTAERLRSRLELDPDDLHPDIGRGWSALSPGQRERWQVAAALASGADVLLLDEPTNHLDGAARDLLVAALERFRGLGLLVSHDRGVLDRLTERTLRIHRGGLVVYAGSYTEASRRWRAEEAARRDAHARARREEQRVRRQLADARRARAATERSSAAARRRGRDPEARSMGERFRTQTAEAAHARRVASTHSKLERTSAELECFDLQRDRGGPVAFSYAPTRRGRLVEVVGDVRHAGGEIWLRDVDVGLDRHERVHVRGANGSGKTTLMCALRAELERTDEVVAWLSQELPEPAAEVAQVRALDPEVRGRLLGVVALLGVDPDRVLLTDDPSPGEARKLALARLLAGTAGVLVLDEPTNHLDLLAIERLEDALRAWGGALVLVTHDDALAAAVATTVWVVEDQRVRVEAVAAGAG